MSSSTRKPLLSQKGLNKTIPMEVKNLIKTKNIDEIRDYIDKEEKIAIHKFNSATLNTRQLTKMFDDLDAKLENYENELLKEATKVLPFKKGGFVKKNSVAVLHKGEKVISANEVKKNKDKYKKGKV